MRRRRRCGLTDPWLLIGARDRRNISGDAPLQRAEGDRRRGRPRTGCARRSSRFSAMWPAMRVLDLLRRLRGARHRGAVARRAAQATLVDSAGGARGDLGQPREARNRGRGGVRGRIGLLRAGTPKAARQYDLVLLDPPYRHGSPLGEEADDGAHLRCWRTGRVSWPRATGAIRWHSACRCSTSGATATR